MSTLVRTILVTLALVGMTFSPVVFAEGCLLPIDCCQIAPAPHGAQPDADQRDACCPLPAPAAQDNTEPPDHSEPRPCSECRCCAARAPVQSATALANVAPPALPRQAIDPGRFTPSRTLQPEPGPPRA